jgi:hypothetical protein
LGAGLREEWQAPLVKVSNFEKYGRSSIAFTETSLTESDIESGEDLKVWLIDFSPRNLME